MENPANSAIFLYILIGIFTFITNPNILSSKDKKFKCLLPIYIIILSVLCYYLFIIVNMIKK